MKRGYGTVRHALSALERDEYQLAPYHRFRFVCWAGDGSLGTMSLDRSYHSDLHMFKDPKLVVSFPRIRDKKGNWLGLNVDAMQTAWKKERMSDQRYYLMKGPGANNCASMAFKVLKAGMDGSVNSVAFHRGWSWDKTFPQTTDAYSAGAELLKLSWMFADQYRIKAEEANAPNAIKFDIQGHPKCAAAYSVPKFLWGQLKVSSTHLDDASALTRR